MITLSTSGTQVKLIFETRKNFTMHFYWECNKEIHAQLLRDHMHECINQKLESIRREAYMEGWKHAKAKSAKRTWFSGWW